MNIFRITVTILPMTLLLACGGGSSSAGGVITPEPLPSLPVTNTQQAITLVGGSEVTSTMTSVEIEEELRTRANAADRLTTDITDLSGVREVTCTGVICIGTITDGTDTYEVQYSLNDFGDTPEVNGEDLVGYNERYSLVMIDGGVTLWQGLAAGRLRGVSFQFQGYGGWLDNSVFAIRSETATDGTDTLTWLTSHSFGDNSGSNPTGGSVLQWTGVMVGANAETGHVIHGDATIEYATSTASVLNNITFSNVKNLDSRGDVTFDGVNRLQFQNIPLNNGVFESASGDIKGSFYGDNHEEVGGIFDNNSIIGAFGATRVTQ